MSTNTATLCIGILTLNESKRIRQCIQSADFADQLVIIDGGSKDETVEIAKSLGAQVYTHTDWQGFAAQRNHLLQYCTCEYIFFLDADEIITNELQEEIKAAVLSKKKANWKVRWSQIAYGKQLSLMKPTGGVHRMFLTSNLSKFDGLVHEIAVIHDRSTPTIEFKNRLLHYSRETVYESLIKLAQYSQLGAAKRLMNSRRGGIFYGTVSAFFKFLQLYIFKRGFLCGAEGFIFCLFIALECFFRQVILRYDANKLEIIATRQIK